MKGIANKARKWIELTWLRKGYKEISLPEIVFEKIDSGGLYYYPRQEEQFINGIYYDLSKGLIIVNPNNDDKNTINTIAHEWRHHWQNYQGFKMELIGTPYNWKNNYKSEILRFFKLNRIERDALLFSIDKAPDNTSLEWMEWTIKHE